MDTNKQSVSSQLAAMNAATAQVVTLTSGPQEDVDHTAVGTSATRGAGPLLPQEGGGREREGAMGEGAGLCGDVGAEAGSVS